MKHIAQTATIFMLLLLTTASAMAAGKVVVTITAQEEIEIINKEGKREIHHTPTNSVIPKDVVLYTINYHNDSTEPAEKVVLSNPIPLHMQYIDDTATSNDLVAVVFSADQGETYDQPENIFIKTKDGKERSAMASDYTHIQWRFKAPLQPGAKGVLEYKARLN